MDTEIKETPLDSKNCEVVTFPSPPALISGTVRHSHRVVLTSYKENCSMGSMELYVDNNRPSNSSDVVSSAMTRLLYSDVGCSAEVCTRTRPPGFICKQNLRMGRGERAVVRNTLKH